jgi:hypothetical protein
VGRSTAEASLAERGRWSPGFHLARFLLLEGTVVVIDRPEYYLQQVGQVLAILVQSASGAEAG